MNNSFKILLLLLLVQLSDKLYASDYSFFYDTGIKSNIYSGIIKYDTDKFLIISQTPDTTDYLLNLYIISRKGELLFQKELNTSFPSSTNSYIFPYITKDNNLFIYYYSQSNEILEHYDEGFNSINCYDLSDINYGGIVLIQQLNYEDSEKYYRIIGGQLGENLKLLRIYENNLYNEGELKKGVHFNDYIEDIYAVNDSCLLILSSGRYSYPCYSMTKVILGFNYYMIWQYNFCNAKTDCDINGDSENHAKQFILANENYFNVLTTDSRWDQYLHFNSLMSVHLFSYNGGLYKELAAPCENRYMIPLDCCSLKAGGFIAIGRHNVAESDTFAASMFLLKINEQGDFAWYKYFEPSSDIRSDFKKVIELDKNEYSVLIDMGTWVIANIKIDETNSIESQEMTDPKLNIFNNLNTIRINYNFSSDIEINCSLYDLKGALVTSLINDFYLSGEHEFRFSKEQLKLKSGVYFLKFKSNEINETRKIVIY
jgi:hypothetical protein